MFQKGNKLSVGNKGGGTKTKAQFVEEAKNKIKKMTIEELATDKVFKQITTLKGRDKKDRQGVKEIALPVYLKSKAEKRKLEITGYENLTDKELDEYIKNKYNKFKDTQRKDEIDESTRGEGEQKE